MTIADVTENAILNLIFSATTWANVAINATASPISTIQMALHTADPTDAGNQSSSESTYGSYARQTVARPGGFGTATVGSVALAANLDFPASAGSGTTVTHFSAGKPGAGATEIFWKGALTPSIPIGAAGVIPRLNSGSTITLD